MQVKDSTANKGGVLSSSIAEVLTGFLFQDQYEEKLLNDTKTRWGLIKDIIHLVDRYSRIETDLLLQIYDADPMVPLFDLSERTSEQIFALQGILVERLDEILADEELVWLVMEHYIPAVLITKLGRDTIMAIFNTPELQAYRDAIVAKKLASLAFYRFGRNWERYLKELKKNFPAPLYKALQQ
jgi:glutamate dehydrogenase